MIEKLHNEIIENLEGCYNLVVLKRVNEILKGRKERRENERNKPYSIEDASQLLEVSTDEAMELIDNGTLKADKDNNIAADDFRKYMNEYFGYEE